MSVLVVGASGQLGRSIVAGWPSGEPVVSCTRADVDLSRHDQLRDFVRAARPSVIVNCAAYNNVDGAEADPFAALDVNACAVRTLARAAEDCDAVLVHYSTDFVFDGTATTPYDESAAPEPKSVYAQSKLMGEWLASGWPRHYVLRVESLFGGPHPRSSVDRIIDAVADGREAPVFVDRTVSPSFVDDVTRTTVELVRRQSPFGLYHCVNSGAATWFDVGREIAQALGRPETCLKPISVRDVSLRAPRPQYAALSNAKLARAGCLMPTWQDAVARYLARRTAA